MRMRTFPTVFTAAAALVAGLTLTGSASASAESPQPSAHAAEARTAGLTAAEAGALQAEVDAVLARQPGTRQISANRLSMPGGTVTLPAPGALGAPLACANGHLCITDGQGRNYDYYHCGYYDFWGVGDGTFNNNQTWGTRARFYNENGSERWSNVAKDTGTASWTPVFHIRPC
ncbi:hypothetical protein [Streptomyces sp. WAC06614]|uniref:hypothetical protein n=1 Tax=Streptomyces sp. WAC06614 TaxID=2487416 RepID=UPI000F770028|nr:hypothetical protein [Streptomyces sp. WAC06614]RSS52925.1 hypothetical protein EF918_35220 [Streptomyces sp. WAC06614]